MRTAIVIEPGPEVLAVAELRSRQSGIELCRHFVRPLPSTGLDSEWLRQTWETERPGGNRVICLIPTHLVHYHTVVVPVLPDEQLEAAVRLELENGSDIHGVHQIKPLYYRLRDRMYHVRAAVIPDQSLTELFELLERAGLTILWSGLRNWGNENFLNFRRDFFTESAASVAFLDITPEQTELGVIQNERLVYCRSFMPGARKLRTAFEAASISPEVSESDPAQPVLNDFWEQFQLSHAAYQGLSGLTLPEPLWLLGETDEFSKPLQDSAAGAGVRLRLPDEIRDVSRAASSSSGHAANDSRIHGALNRKFTSRLAPLLGLGLEVLGFYHHESRYIYSARQQQIRNQKGKWRSIALAGVAACLLLIGLGLKFQAGVEKEVKIGRWLGEQSQYLQRLKRTENQTGVALGRMRNLEAWLEDQGQELAWLRTLQDNLPEGTVVTDLTIEDGVVKELALTAPAASLVLKQLRQVPELAGLMLKGTIMTSNRGEVFHLQGPVAGSPKDTVTQKTPVQKDKETHD